jgi:hypothetical protein
MLALWRREDVHVLIPPSKLSYPVRRKAKEKKPKSISRQSRVEAGKEKLKNYQFQLPQQPVEEEEKKKKKKKIFTA